MRDELKAGIVEIQWLAMLKHPKICTIVTVATKTEARRGSSGNSSRISAKVVMLQWSCLRWWYPQCDAYSDSARNGDTHIGGAYSGVTHNIGAHN